MLGGRFRSVAQALDHPEFAAASKQYTHEEYSTRSCVSTTCASQQRMEKVRQAADRALVLYEDVDSTRHRCGRLPSTPRFIFYAV